MFLVCVFARCVKEEIHYSRKQETKYCSQRAVSGFGTLYANKIRVYQSKVDKETRMWSRPLVVSTSGETSKITQDGGNREVDSCQNLI